MYPRLTAPQAAVRPGEDPGARAGDTVLVLDDSAAQRRMLLALLGRWGRRAIATGDPVEALRLAADPRVGLVLSDWMMPGMTGPEFCRALRASSREGYVYVILLTSKSDAAALAEGLAAGADDFLTKPVQVPELQARVSAGARIVAMQGELVQKTHSLGAALDEIKTLYTAIDTDLEEARRLQKSQLRDAHFPFPGGEVSLWLEASGHVGGDMVGCFRVTDRTIGFYSIDVSGHGVASAMIGARVAAMLNDASPEQNVALSALGHGVFRALPPRLVAKRLNAILLRDMAGDRYLTLCIGLLDLRTGALRMVQAGHPHPFLMDAEGGARALGEGGLPIGLIEGADFAEIRTTLEPGDRLFIYSDGLTECPGADGAMLEEAGLVALLRDHRARAGPAFLDALSAEIVRFAGRRDLPDDVSALVIDFRGPDDAHRPRDVRPPDAR